MNAKKLFIKLKDRGINEAEYRYAVTTSFSCEVFHGELNNYSTNKTSSLNIDAVIKNKLAMINTEKISNKFIDEIISNLFESAKYTSKTDAFIYNKINKYKKYNHYNKELKNVPTEEKIRLVFEIEKRLKEKDNRIQDVQAGYEETERIHEYQNTYGIKIKEKTNQYSFGAFVIIKDNNETKSEFTSFIDNDFSKFNLDTFIEKAYSNAVKKLNPITLDSGKYNVIFSPEATAILLENYVSQLNAELILKNSSWFKDKVNTLVANKKVSILETPLKRDINFSNADDQGVPTVNRYLIKKGLLLTYLHNLETAKAFNVEPTGHASLTGSKIGISAHAALHLKPGRLSKDELITKVNNGIYIKDLSGIHAGMNAQNGDFSLKTEGFLIENGKLTKPIDMMTVSGNLFEIFKSIKNISENIEYIQNGFYSPCIYLNKIAISF